MERTFAYRFKLDDVEQLRAQLRALGPAGEQGLKILGDGAERAGSKVRGLKQDALQATPGLKAVDAAAKDIRSTFNDLAGRIPVIGGALQALGPVGFAVGAGLGGAVLGFNALSNAARKAVTDISEIKDAAENVQLSITDLQAIRGQGLLAGIDRNALDSMLSTFAANSARNAEGFGKMHAALERVNPELAKQLELTQSQAGRIDVLARGIQNATSQNEKLNIAIAAFGQQGGQMVRVLDETGASLDTWRQKAKAAGLVVDEDLVKNVEAMGDRLDVLSAKAGIAGQRFGVAFAPLVEGFEQWKIDRLDNLAAIAAQAKRIEDQTFDQLAIRRNELLRGLQNYRDPNDPSISQINKQIAEIEKILVAQLDKQKSEQALQDMKVAIDDFVAQRGRLAEEASKDRTAAFGRELEKGLKAYAEAARKAAAASEEADRAFQKLVDDQVAAAKSFATQLGSILDSNLTPVEAAQKKWADFVAEAVRLGEHGPDVMAAIRILQAEVDKLAKAERDAADAAVELQLSHDMAADAFARTREATFELNFALGVMDGILNYQIDSWEDVGRVAAQVLAQIAADSIRTAAQVKNASLGDLFAAGFGGVLGLVGINLGAPPAAAGAGLGSSLASAVRASVHHAGEVIGSPAPTRLVPLAVVDGAPRHHTGMEPYLRPGERAVIAEDGERMFSRVDNARLVRAFENGMGGGITVNIFDQAGVGVQARERQGPGGQRELDLFLTPKVLDIMTGRAGRKAMAATYGIGPMARGG